MFKRDAVGSLNDIRCSYNIAKQLKSLAVTAFGEPNTWTEAKVNELGNMMGEQQEKKNAVFETFHRILRSLLNR